VQIPCLNEEETIAAVIRGIPTSIPGVASVEILVIDDGSSDRTGEVARAAGATHVLRHAGTMGLARSFRDGADYALAHGADILVNTDGDNQYPQDRIPDLLRPILESRADIVIGDRQTDLILHFSPWKRFLQRFGSRVVNVASGTAVPDAASGFRAYSRRSLLRLNLVTGFSYSMETIVQAGHKRLPIVSVPIQVNPKTRESRLFRHMGQHVFESGKAIVRSYLMFRPLAFFLPISAVLLLLAIIPYVRFLILLDSRNPGGHVQSLILGTAFLVGSLMAGALGIMAELMRINRVLIEDVLERVKAESYRSSGWDSSRQNSD